MWIRVFHRRLLAGMVLFALLLQTVLPVVAGATSYSSGQWIEVCAASGAKWIKLDPDTAGHSQAHSDHCVFCAATGAAPEFDAALYLRVAATEVLLGANQQSYFSSNTDRLALARAPPCSS
jgi:hypothetical protein